MVIQSLIYITTTERSVSLKVIPSGDGSNKIERHTAEKEECWRTASTKIPFTRVGVLRLEKQQRERRNK